MTKVCWICGGPSESGEHIIKSSDIKDVIGLPSKQSPIYIRTERIKNLAISGIKSKKLKWQNRICKNCNNNLTAPYDKSWAKLSNYLSKIPTYLDRINLKFVFKRTYKEDIKNLQLYFVKVLGFAITNSGDNFDISSLSNALINGKTHPDIYLTFGFYEEWPINKMIRLSDLSICSDIYGVVLATISYHIGPWQISVSYWIKRAPLMPLIEHSFHPTKINRQKAKVMFFKNEPTV